jgi:hypothetical protein
VVLAFDVAVWSLPAAWPTDCAGVLAAAVPAPDITRKPTAASDANGCLRIVSPWFVVDGHAPGAAGAR